MNEHDPSIALLELLAYAIDVLSHFQDQIVREASARKRWRAAAVGTAAVALWCCRRGRRSS